MKNEEFWGLIPYFKKSEFDCKCGCGQNNISQDFVKQLSQARYLSQTPFNINSACRCSSHNSEVEGSQTSSHIKGLAVDIKVNSSVDRFNIIQSLTACGFKRIGVYKTFIHVDIDSSKSQDVMWYA